MYGTALTLAYCPIHEGGNRFWSFIIRLSLSRLSKPFEKDFNTLPYSVFYTTPVSIAGTTSSSLPPYPIHTFLFNLWVNRLFTSGSTYANAPWFLGSSRTQTICLAFAYLFGATWSSSKGGRNLFQPDERDHVREPPGLTFLGEVVAELSGEDDNVIYSRRVGDWVVQDAGWNSASNSEGERGGGVAAGRVQGGCAKTGLRRVFGLSPLIWRSRVRGALSESGPTLSSRLSTGT
jgi:hypothetical protein